MAGVRPVGDDRRDTLPTRPSTSAKLTVGPSLSDQAYRSVRQMIVDGTLPAGERITERPVGDLLGVSATPIREAFRRLSQERLIERPDSRSVIVAAPSAEDLRKANLIRAALGWRPPADCTS